MLVLFLAMQASAPLDVNVNVRTCRICDVVSLFRGDSKKRHEKAVGKLLANGDCAGAETYALENGEFDLADRVKERCATRTASPSQQVLSPAAPNGHVPAEPQQPQGQ